MPRRKLVIGSVQQTFYLEAIRGNVPNKVDTYTYAIPGWFAPINLNYIPLIQQKYNNSKKLGLNFQPGGQVQPYFEGETVANKDIHPVTLVSAYTDHGQSSDHFCVKSMAYERDLDGFESSYKLELYEWSGRLAVSHKTLPTTNLNDRLQVINFIFERDTHIPDNPTTGKPSVYLLRKFKWVKRYITKFGYGIRQTFTNHKYECEWFELPSTLPYSRTTCFIL